MRIITLPLGATGANCYIADAGNGKGLIIDPGYDGELIASEVERQGLKPAAILFTHMHFDHIMGVNEIQSLLPSPVPMYIHSDDKAGLSEGSINLSSMAYDIDYKVKGEVTAVSDGETLSVGDISLKVMNTPGHTPGSVCYISEEEGIVFSGDTLFKGTIGRTDFPGGSVTVMKRSLERLSALPDNFVLYPGHGDKTTVALEKKTNPYLTGGIYGF